MNIKNRSILMIVLAGTFLSTLGIATRVMESASGLQIVFYRAVGLAVFSTLIVMYLNRGDLISAFVRAGWPALVAGFFLSMASVAVVLALVNTSVANAMFIVSLTPLFTAILAWIFIGEQVKVKTWLAIAVALCGVLIIVNGALSTEGLVGIAYALAMAVSYGLFNVSLRFGKDQDMMPAICWSSYFLVISLGFALDDKLIPGQDLLICLSLGVFQVGVGGFLLIAGSKHVPAAQLALLAMLEVVLNPIWVWLGVGEVPTFSTMTGGVIILCAIAYEAMSQHGKSVSDSAAYRSNQ